MVFPMVLSDIMLQGLPNHADKSCTQQQIMTSDLQDNNNNGIASVQSEENDEGGLCTFCMYVFCSTRVCKYAVHS